MTASVERKGFFLLTPLILALICVWYLFATLPYLDRFPTIGRDESQVAAPAWTLASKGVYGQEMFTGYYRSERYVYEFLPLHPFMIALSFALFGPGTWQMRLPSVVCGLATILLTFGVGRKLYGNTVGLLAAGALCCLRLTIEARTSGMPLLDLARIARYDIAVPPFVLASAWLFVAATERGLTPIMTYLLVGLLAGMASLAHVYGAFVMPLFVILLLWQMGWSALRRPPLYLLIAGWLLAALAWGMYALQDPAAYYGQTLWDQQLGRYSLLHRSFYWHNIVSVSPLYKQWFGVQGDLLLRPRLGIWLLFIGISTTYGSLFVKRFAQQAWTCADRFLLLSVLIPASLLVLLITSKLPNYVVLVLPFLALQSAYGLHWLFVWLNKRSGHLARSLGSLVLIGALLESGLGCASVLQQARKASPFMDISAALGRLIPAGSHVLGIHNLWPAMVQYDVRSLDLPFRLSNPRYYQPHALSMQQALSHVAPDYIVIDPLIDRYVIHSNEQDDDPVLKAQKRAFTSTLLAHCTTRVGTIDAARLADYGPLTVVACRW